MSEPEWREVAGTSGLYEVSDQGVVRSHHRSTKSSTGILKVLNITAGYGMVGLHVGGVRTPRYVHHLVAEAFIGPRPDGQQIRHVNGDKRDNRASNLAYGTSSENNLDQVRHGTHPEARKTHCPRGHAYDDQNTYRPPAGGRVCRPCANIRYADRAALRLKETA